MDFYQFPVLDVQMTGRTIREVCLRKGLTVRDLRITLGIGSFQSVYSWFSGKTLPSLDHMTVLSHLLKTPMDVLVCTTGERIWEMPLPEEAAPERLRRYGEFFSALKNVRPADIIRENRRSLKKGE